MRKGRSEPLLLSHLRGAEAAGVEEPEEEADEEEGVPSFARPRPPSVCDAS